MRIREAVPGDVPDIARLERENFSLPWTEPVILAQLTCEGRVLLAAEAEGGALAGYAGLQYVLDEGYVTNVCTAREYRRRGVASALVDELASRAQRLGLSFLSLEARASNEAAIRLYEGKGFVKLGLRPGYYEQPVEDAVIMNLEIRKESRC